MSDRNKLGLLLYIYGILYWTQNDISTLLRALGFITFMIGCTLFFIGDKK